MVASLHRFAGTGGVVDGFADAGVGGAAAEIAGHGGVDLGVGEVGMRGEQGSSAEDLSALAVATLGYVEVDPGLLKDVEFAVLGEAFDGGDVAFGFGDGDLAGTFALAVDE